MSCADCGSRATRCWPGYFSGNRSWFLCTKCLNVHADNARQRFLDRWEQLPSKREEK